MRHYTLIFETLAGSHLYGTALPTSDIDYRGVGIEAPEHIFGLTGFEQEVTLNEKDRTIYGLKKFCQLALDNNPNIIELLFAPIETAVLCAPVWKNDIVENRHLFLSIKVKKTFVGYALAQAKKMETHNRWLTSNAPVNPNPEDYGQYKNDKGGVSWADHTEFQRYQSDKKYYDNYQTWVKNRNLIRSELEQKFGYDTKNGMHIVRLLTQGEELLKTGHLTFPRPNADFLLEVRNGLFYYDEMVRWMEEKIEYLDTLETALPSKPDSNGVERILMAIYRRYL